MDEEEKKIFGTRGNILLDISSPSPPQEARGGELKEKSRHRYALQFPSERERAAISGVRSMDLKEMMDGCGGPWTEERHSAFLNWVEESFVRRVLAARDNDPSPHLDLDVDLGASGWLPPPLPLDRFLPDSATESNRNPWRPARPARTRRSATTAVEAEKSEEEEEEESVVTSRHRKRKPQPLLSHHKYLKDQLGRAKPDDGITSHKMKAGEAGASQIALRDANTTLSKKRSASNRSVGAV